MRIVVVGAGKLGYSIAELLSKEQFEVVVIDEDPVEGIEDTYSELAKNAETDENHFTAVRNALRRLTNLQDATGKIYFYDSVEVLSAQDYMNKLKLMA